MNNLEIVRNYFSLFWEGKKDELFNLIDNNAIWTMKGSDNVPYEILDDSFGIYLSFLDN